jgi:hypothetical protein
VHEISESYTFDLGPGGSHPALDAGCALDEPIPKSEKVLLVDLAMERTSSRTGLAPAAVQRFSRRTVSPTALRAPQTVRFLRAGDYRGGLNHSWA